MLGMRKGVLRGIYIAACIVPTAAIFSTAFCVVGAMVYAAHPGAVEVMDASFLFGTGLAAIALMMASCVDPTRYLAIRERLVTAGALLTIGSILNVVSLVVRYAVRFGDAAWWSAVEIDPKTPGRGFNLFLILVPYELGSFVALIGLIGLLNAMGIWLLRGINE